MIVDGHSDLAPFARGLVLDRHHPFVDDDRVARRVAGGGREHAHQPSQKQAAPGGPEQRVIGL